jgi:hypothetical protein
MTFANSYDAERLNGMNRISEASDDHHKGHEVAQNRGNPMDLDI